MAQVIQFPCPACHTTLSVPLQAASQRGPCPHCGQLLIAPDPYRGIAARLLPQASPAPEPPEPPVVRLQPAPADPDPHRFPTDPRPPSRQPENTPPPATAAASPPAAELPPPRSIWPTTLGVGALAALLGFAGGYQSARPLRPPPAARQPETVLTRIVPPPSISGNAMSAPKEALKSFLAAKDWKSRSAHVLFPERVIKRMESYHATHPDGPTTATRLTVEHCESDASSELLLVIIRVTTAECPTGFTVAVEETPDGWKTDWEAFVEFKDMLFDRFTAGNHGDVGRFHVVAQKSAGPAPQENTVSYLLTDPVKATEHPAYAVKGSGADTTLSRLNRESELCTPVLELVRHPQPDGTDTLEIRSVAATNWRPQRGN